METFDIYRLEVAERWRAAANGEVEILIPGIPRRYVDARRHAALAASRESYNEQAGSYWNGVGLGRKLREFHKLNIPREITELRDNMVENLKYDFGRDEEKVA